VLSIVNSGDTLLAVGAVEALGVVHTTLVRDSLSGVDSLLAGEALGTTTTELGESTRSSSRLLRSPLLSRLKLLTVEAVLGPALGAVKLLLELVDVVDSAASLAVRASKAVAVVRLALEGDSLSRVASLLADSAGDGTTTKLKSDVRVVTLLLLPSLGRLELLTVETVLGPALGAVKNVLELVDVVHSAAGLAVRASKTVVVVRLTLEGDSLSRVASLGTRVTGDGTTTKLESDVRVVTLLLLPSLSGLKLLTVEAVLVPALGAVKLILELSNVVDGATSLALSA